MYYCLNNTIKTIKSNKQKIKKFLSKNVVNYQEKGYNKNVHKLRNLFWWNISNFILTNVTKLFKKVIKYKHLTVIKVIIFL